ncbi:FAD-binding oxidoreductase [Jiangella sp. DSM 45060]|uniref:FAD-binding oxidoreductase n=1 Tax=Jiangella sp. DSM 45060 TaxID=1798224 RepID=UPI00087AA61F|nr:FAD-binding oxidoreductase [Jiangella sp. DSM 45060]SDS94962.1 FAD/FMN-containing dehydrogenase [Jiangella sp. DSM 45060]
MTTTAGPEPRPLAVVGCRSAADVAGAIDLARRHGVPAVPRSGGHCFAGRSWTSGVVIDVRPMRTVTAAGDRVTVGAGVRLGELYAELARHGMTLPAGCGPTVGIAGLTLGGGFGILGRRYGLTADRLTAARVVLADGRVVDCDEERHADLFWALRGAGGGQFGVVTELTFRAVPEPEVTAFHLAWPVAEAAAVLAAWQEWSPDGPDELAASLLLVGGPDPGRPPVANVFGTLLGGEPETAALLARFIARVGTPPATQAVATRPYAATKQHLAELGARMAGPATEHRPLSRSEYVARSLPEEAVAALVDGLARDRVAGETRELDVSPWGGAYTRVPVDATAFAHREARFLVKHAVTGPDPAGWLDRSWAAAHPWGTGGVYPNFPDPRLDDPLGAYHGPNLARLRQVKAAYDPGGFFDFPQSIRA